MLGRLTGLRRCALAVAESEAAVRWDRVQLGVGQLRDPAEVAREAEALSTAPTSMVSAVYSLSCRPTPGSCWVGPCSPDIASLVWTKPAIRHSRSCAADAPTVLSPSFPAGAPGAARPRQCRDEVDRFRGSARRWWHEALCCDWSSQLPSGGLSGRHARDRQDGACPSGCRGRRTRAGSAASRSRSARRIPW